ncbi:hypothetical protein GQ53DRAFT_371226 [Thozetella sp. PMI_491]|nr:hypothetical protein GQ53DRAFT_371226 [Thozetella sp. PMI_491]
MPAVYSPVCMLSGVAAIPARTETGRRDVGRTSTVVLQRGEVAISSVCPAVPPPPPSPHLTVPTPLPIVLARCTIEGPWPPARRGYLPAVFGEVGWGLGVGYHPLRCALQRSTGGWTKCRVQTLSLCALSYSTT